MEKDNRIIIEGKLVDHYYSAEHQIVPDLVDEEGRYVCLIRDIYFDSFSNIVKSLVEKEIGDKYEYKTWVDYCEKCKKEKKSITLKIEVSFGDKGWIRKYVNNNASYQDYTYFPEFYDKRNYNQLVTIVFSLSDELLKDLQLLKNELSDL
jgi:hypothetical protein